MSKKKSINYKDIKIERVYGDKPFLDCIKEFVNIKLSITEEVSKNDLVHKHN